MRNLTVEDLLFILIFRTMIQRLSIRKAEKAGLKSTYQQKVYYFASAENRARFDQDPGRYAGKPSEATPSGDRIHMH